MEKVTIEVEAAKSVFDLQLLDKEWVELILEAKQLGMTKEEISNFLHLHK